MHWIRLASLLVAVQNAVIARNNKVFALAGHRRDNARSPIFAEALTSSMSVGQKDDMKFDNENRVSKSLRIIVL